MVGDPAKVGTADGHSAVVGLVAADVGRGVCGAMTDCGVGDKVLGALALQPSSSTNIETTATKILGFMTASCPLVVSSQLVNRQFVTSQQQLFVSFEHSL